MERVLWMDGGDGCTAMWMYLMTLNGTPTNGEGVRFPKGHATLCSLRFSVRQGPELSTGAPSPLWAIGKWPSPAANFWTVVLEKTFKSALNCKEINQSILKEINPEYIGRTNAEAEAPILLLLHWCEELIHWKRLWCWERLKAGGEGDDRGWDGWMASQTPWTWVWANCRRSWKTGKPHILQPIRLQRVWHDWVTEKQQQSKVS